MEPDWVGRVSEEIGADQHGAILAAMEPDQVGRVSAPLEPVDDDQHLRPQWSPTGLVECRVVIPSRATAANSMPRWSPTGLVGCRSHGIGTEAPRRTAAMEPGPERSRDQVSRRRGWR